jgi:hypothetical protein
MTKQEIEIGKVYTAKISGKLAPVRILSESLYGGWEAMNTRTSRTVRIRSAQKLRGEWKPARCGQCANCKTLAQEKVGWTERYRAAISVDHEAAAALRQGWRARLEELPCQE